MASRTRQPLPRRSAYTLKRAIVFLAVAFVLVGLGFAVRLGEDNQVGMSNDVSTWVFFTAGLSAYYALVVGWIILRRHLKSRNGCDKLSLHSIKKANSKETR